MKKLQDENSELKDTLSRVKDEMARAQENQAVLEIFRQKEEDYENLIRQLSIRLKGLEEDVRNNQINIISIDLKQND